MNENQNTAETESGAAAVASAPAPTTRAERTAQRKTAQATAPKPAPAAKGESRAQRDAKNQAARMAKLNADPEVKAIRADLAVQSTDAAKFDPTRRVARREFGANGEPQSNPKVRARSAR